MIEGTCEGDNESVTLDGRVEGYALGTLLRRTDGDTDGVGGVVDAEDPGMGFSVIAKVSESGDRVVRITEGVCEGDDESKGYMLDVELMLVLVVCARECTNVGDDDRNPMWGAEEGYCAFVLGKSVGDGVGYRKSIEKGIREGWC
jgi:hypothetical protein